MTGQSLLRLFGVILTGLIVFGMVIGSIRYTQIDPMMAVQRPTQVILLPTQTLFPTQIPDTETPTDAPTETATDLPTGTPTNTDTPLPTDTPVQPTPTNTVTPASPLVVQCDYPAGWFPYIVQEDDTVYALALKADTSTLLLLQANCVGTTEDIKSGTTLYLPPIAFATSTPRPYVCGPPATWRIVIVNPGETLYGLSIRYGTTINALMRANCISTSKLYAGQPLFVPPYIVVPPTPVWTPWPTPTPTPLLPTPTFTVTPVITPTSTTLPTLIPTWTPTATPGVTWTPTPTFTPGPSDTPTPTSTISETPTPTPTDIPSLTPTPTITPIPSLTPTWTPITTTVNLISD